MHGQRVVVRDSGGDGVGSYEASTATISHLLVQDSAHRGLSASRARLLVTDAAISRSGEPGLLVGQGSEVSLERALVEQSQGAGVWVGSGSEVTLRDVHIRDSRSTPMDGYAEGIAVKQDSQAFVTRTSVRSSVGHGVVVEKSEITAQDLVVTETEAVLSSDVNGEGVVLRGAFATLERLFIERARHIGLYASEASDEMPTDATLTDVYVRQIEIGRTEEDDELGGGFGLSVRNSEVQVIRLVSTDNRAAAVALNDSQVDLTDVLVAQTLPDPSKEPRAAGVSVHGGTTTIDRLRSYANAEGGARLTSGADVTITNARFGDVNEKDAQATGVKVEDALSKVSIDASVIGPHSEAGLLVEVGELRVSNSRVTGNQMGALLLSPSTRPEDVLRGVLYEDNGQHICLNRDCR
jgi:hypothetical protein